jgi:predicted ribosome quality control (RQC) complex YloA/Tae2 family protein
MELILDLRKSVRENLQEKYAILRKLKEKRTGLLKAIEQTKKELAALEKKDRDGKASLAENAALPAAFAKKKAKNYWFSQYLTFITSKGRRVVAGKDAKQNDELYAKHLAKEDLFFHADVYGAPATILKDGQRACEDEKKEAAQWAASYSSAWKRGEIAADVYALKPEQVSKHATGGYVGRGAFVLTGEREWFRQVQLALKIGLYEDEGRKAEDNEIAKMQKKKESNLNILPAIHPAKLKSQVLLMPGDMPKEEAAKIIAGKLGVKMQEVLQVLPAGKFVIK